MSKRKRKRVAEDAGSSPPKRKRKRKAAKRRKKRASASSSPKRRKRSSAPRRRRSSSPRRRSSSGRGFKFEVRRVKLNRGGYDSHGKYFGANTGGQKLYAVRVIDRATDIYSESHVRARTMADAKSDVMASMMRSIDKHTPAPQHPLMGHARHSNPTHGSFGGIASSSDPMRRRRGRDRVQGTPHAINLEASTDADLNQIANDPWAHASYRQLAALYLRSRAARMRGDINEAMRFERDAEFVYDKLPSELRW